MTTTTTADTPADGSFGTYQREDDGTLSIYAQDRGSKRDLYVVPPPAATAGDAKTVDTPEFHALVMKVYEAECKFAAAGVGNPVYEGFEGASLARQALIKYIDAHTAQAIATRQAAPAGDALDANRLDLLDENCRFGLSWKVGFAPAGNTSINTVLGIKPAVKIRDAIDAAMREKGGA